MISKTKDWMRYCSYWHTWDRVLLRRGGTQNEYPIQYEITLTPINGDAGDWEELLQVRLRGHRTDTSKDRWTHHLPDGVHQILTDKFGEEVADFFIHADIYSNVDWDKYKEVNKYWSGGGGIPYMMIVKDNPDFVIPSRILEYWVVNGGKITEAYHMHRDNCIREAALKLEQKFNLMKNPGVFGEFMDYITTADHIWNPDKYIQSRTMNGESYGQETVLRFQYVLGNAYADGHVGNWRFRVFKTHATFQLYLTQAGQPWPDQCTFSVSSHQRQELMQFFAEKVSR